GGTENRFNPIAFNAKELQDAVDKIAEAARASGAMGDSAQLNQYKSQLANDALFRNEQWEHYIQLGKLKPRTLASGTQLHSNHFSYQYITKLKDGYQRNFDNGRIEHFNEEGRLTRIADRNNNFIELSYNKEGKLAKLVDNSNRKMFFTFNNQGLLEKVQ